MSLDPKRFGEFLTHELEQIDSFTSEERVDIYNTLIEAGWAFENDYGYFSANGTLLMKKEATYLP